MTVEAGVDSARILKRIVKAVLIKYLLGVLKMNRYLWLFVISLCMAFGSAQAQTTGTTGGGQPFNNMQPSLAVTEVIPMFGIFPPRDGGSATGDTLGFVYDFAGNFAPGGSTMAQGQILPISSNTAVFSLLGTTYGGNGTTNFALPNLAGTAIVGTGTGPGLFSQSLGQSTGSATVTLTTGQLPAHDHTLSGGGVTGMTGGSQPFNNDQPSLALNYLIATSGIFPPRDGGSGFDQSIPTLGQITEFAGNFAPSGWAIANGQLLSIAQNQALFSILGTQYGGDGITTFALPDLRGRTLIGDDANYFTGETLGTDATTLTVANLPAHYHTLPAVATPEPVTILLLGFGLVGLTGVRRRMS
jgi:microcystin-dependent protein